MKAKRILKIAACLVVVSSGLFNAVAADLPPSGTNTIIGLVGFTNSDDEILARLGPPGIEGMSAFVAIGKGSAPAVSV